MRLPATTAAELTAFPLSAAKNRQSSHVPMTVGLSILPVPFTQLAERQGFVGSGRHSHRACVSELAVCTSALAWSCGGLLIAKQTRQGHRSILLFNAVLLQASSHKKYDTVRLTQKWRPTEQTSPSVYAEYNRTHNDFDEMSPLI